MQRSVTTFLSLLLLAFAALPAWAQPQQVTIREINAIPQSNIDQLNALGTDVTEDDLADNGGALMFGDLLGAEVQFQAVVLSDPLNSGLASPNDEGLPSRVHFFVRDVAAGDEGNEGMTIQIVDGAWQENGVDGLTVGDVIEVVGIVDPFFTTMQVAPTSISLLGRYNDGISFDLPESILQPVIASTSEINAAAGEGTVLINWDNLANLRNQFVRIENATVIDRDVSTDRPNWTISSDGGETFVSFYDTSLRYRNDQSDYNVDVFNVLDDDFVPPPIGAVVNVEAFLTMNSDDPFDRAASEDIILSFNPMEDDDVVVTEAPPTVTALSVPSVVPTTEPVTITAEVRADVASGRSIANVELQYTTSSSTEVQTVAATNTSGDTYEAEIPAQADGDFVTYYIVAEDNAGGVTTSASQSTRFLADGINEIEDIQLTADGGPGTSPFVDITTAMNITATVQSNPSVSGFLSIQDDPSLGPWSGVFVEIPDGMTFNPGDVVEITQATIEESFGAVTTLADPTITVTSSGDPLGYLEVTTDVLLDEAIAEAHEGMLLTFSDVTITDPDAGFGEFAFSSDGTEDNAINGDDASDALPGGPDLFTEGEVYEFIRGIWWYSFGQYKLVPESTDDIGPMVGTSNETEELPEGYALHQNFPNPFNPTTSISYEIGQAGPVTLEVFDMLGRRVRTLVEGTQPVGAHTVSFDAKDLSSGLYLYRLTAGSTVVTKTMVLLK